MSISLIRRNSDLPNIANYDDARINRFAIGDYEGFVKGIGNELDLEQFSGSVVDRKVKLKIKSGLFYIQGWDVIINQEGYEITLTSPGSGNIYYTVYATIDLSSNSNQTVSINSSYAMNTYPTINTGDDLSINTTGRRNIELYRVVITVNSFSSVKVIQRIKYNKELLRDLQSSFEEKMLSLPSSRLTIDDVNKVKAKIKTYDETNVYSDSIGKSLYYLSDTGQTIFNDPNKYLYGRKFEITLGNEVYIFNVSDDNDIREKGLIKNIYYDFDKPTNFIRLKIKISRGKLLQVYARGFETDGNGNSYDTGGLPEISKKIILYSVKEIIER